MMEKREAKNKPWIVAYAKGEDTLKIEPAPRTRGWMESLPAHFANRCLPLVIANQAGWFVFNNRPFEAVWRGGRDKNSLRIRYGRGDGHCWASSHFGNGILTFTLPFLFRTSAGINVWVRGPSNQPKDGIAPLEGIVETEWSVAPFTMNWKFTRANNRIRFDADEPIMMLVPISVGDIECVQPTVEHLDANRSIKESFDTWRSSRAQFIEELRTKKPGSKKHPWQKHYFVGVSPDGIRAPQHRLKLELHRFEWGALTTKWRDK